MNAATSKSILCVLLLAGMSFGSHSLDPKSEFASSKGILLDSAWKDVFTWTSANDRRRKTIFRHEWFSLELNDELNLNYFISKNNTNLVMVSASRYTVLGKSIHEHPNAIAVFPTRSFYDFVLIDLPNEQEREVLAAVAHEDIGACGALVPVSLNQNLASLSSPISPVYSTIVKLPTAAALSEKVSTTKIQGNIATLEALGSRYYSGANAAKTVATVKSMWQAYVPAGASVTEFANGSGSPLQNNVVLTIPGSKDDNTTVVVGAHLDSINRSDLTNAPGADDDASGIATLTELIRIIHDSGVTFNRRVEFHAYAAEEVGLVGSTQMAKSYADANRKVAGMFQMDMNAFSTTENAGKIFLVTTDTSPVLTRGLKDLLDLYMGGNYAEMSLSAGTSDHKSWMNSGFHAVFPFEHPQNYNKALHSSGDTSTLLDVTLAARFGKLAALWLAHNAGIGSAASEYASGLARINNAANDLKIAENPGQETGSRISVAAPATATSIISCVVASASAAGCDKDPSAYVLARHSESKNFFSNTTDLTISDGDLHRFIAYDANGVALAQRNIQFKRK